MCKLGPASSLGLQLLQGMSVDLCCKFTSRDRVREREGGGREEWGREGREGGERQRDRKRKTEMERKRETEIDASV